MTARCCWAVAAAVVLCGCGGEARREAVGLGKILSQDRAGFAAANAQEKDLVTATRGWTEAIVSGGAGTGQQLAQNASVASDLAKSAEGISAQLGQMRQAIYDQALQQEFPQSVRSTLITGLTKRQRLLQDLRAALAESAAQFNELRQMRDYKGDSYPTAIDKLSRILQGYTGPTDVIGDALGSLKEKYGLAEADLLAGV